MTVINKKFKVKNDVSKPKFHDITEQVKNIVKDSKIKNGIVVVYSQHTTCSVIIQEESHDTILDGTKTMHQDLLDVFEKIIPRCRKEGQYLHPGNEHIDHATKNLNEQATWSLNTDAHLRSVIMGRSETIPILNNSLELGEFGEIYFVDFDSVRQRERNVNVQIIGEMD
jgi:secondary thiamine-phosphate synthase enzyme